jgi:hypothetical protein
MTLPMHEGRELVWAGILILNGGSTALQLTVQNEDVFRLIPDDSLTMQVVGTVVHMTFGQ